MIQSAPTTIKVKCSRCGKTTYVPIMLQGRIPAIEDASKMHAVWDDPHVPNECLVGPIGWVCQNGCKK